VCRRQSLFEVFSCTKLFTLDSIPDDSRAVSGVSNGVSFESTILLFKTLCFSYLQSLHGNLLTHAWLFMNMVIY